MIPPRYARIFLSLGLFFLSAPFNASTARPSASKHILILYEGNDSPSNYGRGDARELAMLLGHFDVDLKLEGLDGYRSGDIEKYDVSFFIGYSGAFDPPDRFLRDVYTTHREVVWMNTGFKKFSESFDLPRQFGIRFIQFDTTSYFTLVKANGRSYTKGEPNINVVALTRDSKAQVLAVAYSTKSRKQTPYIVRSKHLLFIADSPFAEATETDRYILFADMLHEILGEAHEEVHRALLRIEDVDVFENPARLRDIADMLSSKHVPFLVGIIPFFVDPGAGMRLSLSDKPDFVDAIHYMVEHGATIVMHGVTHQYQGVTAIDYEFWDGSTDKPVKSDSRDYVRKKIRMGLEECWKNNIYPLIWETPHYAASQLDYPVFASFFSTAMEQRQVIDDLDYGQYFPYIIEHDLYGQRIIPENLGYVPVDDDPRVEENAIETLLRGAEVQLSVRDGFASAFIHPFVEIKYMEEYVDGVSALGYTFMDAKDETHLVQLGDRVIATGDTTFAVTLEDQYLRETWLAASGEVDHWEISPDRVHGQVKKTISVAHGQIYLAEPSEYREEKLTVLQKLESQARAFVDNLFHTEDVVDEARVAVRWDPGATGSAHNDQSSFVSAFRSLNIPVDTLGGDTLSDLSTYNLLIVPYGAVERLSNREYDRIVQFMELGGHVMTDGKNSLAEEFGVRYASSSIKIERMRDRLYPEDLLVLNTPEIMTRYEVDSHDVILCADERTDAPVVIGRPYGKGKFIYFGLRFDPLSTGGYSRFPYALEYVVRYFQLTPILKRENLEMYFDPGYRRTMSVEDLVKRWVVDGIRVIHVAAWHQYPTWTYDYARLIELCHANGIMAYAWLEPPHVSQKFWKDHPEWREVNYKGEPVPQQWRYLMALTSAECLKAVKTRYKEFLTAFDWDGVNLAELYFEPGQGPRNPRLYTPMHPSARQEFARKAGFDPALLLDSLSEFYWRVNHSALKQFEDYRAETITRLHEEFLRMINDVRSGRPDLDVIVTALDNIGNPELRPYFGVEIQRMFDLRKQYAFTLQVEDPQSQWSKDPRRYAALGKKYQALAGPHRPVMVDLNILQFRSEHVPTRFPTLIQTGIESYQLVHSAAQACNRFAIYAESSVRPQDLRMMAYAASARTVLGRIPGGWHIQSPLQVALELPNTYAALRSQTGERFTSDRGSFLLPAGEHTLIAERQSTGPFSSPPSGGTLICMTGELTSLASSSRAITFTYKSTGRCYASFTHAPYSVILDGAESPVQPMKGYRRFSIVLPKGEHTATAVLETTVSYGVDITSFWSSWLIVGFGFLSGVALLISYVLVKILRPQEIQV